MKWSSPRKTALRISLMSSFLVLMVLLLSLRVTGLWLAFLCVLGITGNFVAVYFFTYYSLNSFIFDRINPIYKTIHNTNIIAKNLRKDLEYKNVLAEVEHEVLNWAQKKSVEVAELKQLEKYRREFLGNVSHELKTPIFNIQGYVLTLLDGGLEDKSINRKYLERTEKSINRMISIVEDLESIARLESGELKLQMERFNILRLFEEVFDLQEMMASERKIKLDFDTDYDKPIFVRADRKRILELANNLIVNSLKYGKEGGQTLISFSDMGENLLIEVTDNGLGISEKDIPRIFERFYRTDKSRSRDMGGTGLGLSIVKHIIEAHDQTINVRSKLGEGSTFAFTLSKA